jgi:hypothetical protein
MVVQTQDGVISQRAGILVHQLLDLEELNIDINQELSLLIFARQVILEQWSLIASDKLLVHTPSDLSHQVNDRVSQSLLLLGGKGINSTLYVPSLLFKPGFLESQLTVFLTFPELVLHLQ